MRMGLIKVSASALISTLLLYIFTLPIYLYRSPIFYPLLIVSYSVAYLATIDWRIIPVYGALAIACLPGLLGITYTIYLIAMYNFIAYILAGIVGEGWDRIRSIIIFWVIMQIAEIAMNLTATLIRYTNLNPGLPEPIEAPIYMLGYLIVSAIHLNYGVKGGITTWIEKIPAKIKQYSVKIM